MNSEQEQMWEQLAELIRRASRGEAEAYRQVVERFQDMAYGYAFALLGDFSLAEDAAQEAFIEAYLSLGDLREPRAFPAWFKRIVFKHCDRILRARRAPLLPLESAPQLVSSAPGPAEAAEARDLQGRVLAAVQALPRHERIVTALFYINGYSQQEIGDFLELPASTVKSRLHASRRRLKERMLNMVQEELGANTLPQDFSRDITGRALERARQLNQERQFEQAEQVLRGVLQEQPEHPRALLELNRALMRGQVYGQARWNLLPELARQGRLILQSSADETVRAQLAQTLLAIPAMPQAVEFLQGWIAQAGPGLERLGMLAWALACCGDYQQAEDRWDDLAVLAEAAQPQTVLAGLTTPVTALVDCFSVAGEPARACKVAGQGWQIVQRAARRSGATLTDPHAWMSIACKAGLELDDTAREALAFCTSADALSRGAAITVRAWVDDPQQVRAEWLGWVRERTEAGEWQWIEALRLPMITALRQRKASLDQSELAEATWRLLSQSSDPAAADALRWWNLERFNYFGYVDRGDWAAVERLARQGFAKGAELGASGLILAAVARGEPTPPEVVRMVAEQGVSSVDDYGLWGWYVIAREAAADGDGPAAFDALQRAADYWANPPGWPLDYMENDTRWGALRASEEFRQIIAEKRSRIGPLRGSLHYFPGW